MLPKLAGLYSLCSSRAKSRKMQRGYIYSMSDTPSGFRASKLTPEEMADAKRLGAKFATLKANTGMTKAQFAKEFKVPGGASMISQNTSGIRPISLAQAKAYMRGFNCTLDEISPTLAAQLPTKLAIPTQLTERLATADEATRKLIHIALLEEGDAALQQLSPSILAMVRMVKTAIAAEDSPDT